MAQNYAAAHLKVLDERFYTESKTDIIVNKGIRLDFNGKNSVTIYNVDTVAENDYVRSGSNRFGALVELGTGTQTFTLSQDKSFTFTVDRGNLEDSQMAQEVGKAVKRQVREVSVPATDVYRLSVLTSYAITNTQGVVGGTAVAYNTIYSLILAQNAALSEAEVPEEGRVLFITPTNLNLLKRDPEFMRDCDTSYKDLKKGIVGMVDGLTIVSCPSSYYVTKFEFMIVHESLLVSPTKFNSVRVLDDVQGIDGSVAEGRRYYDAFIPSQKATAVRVYTKA
ncbi:N4-gp56 family major capsid protein [Candidatus Saccharibacteria bacterium]|nr:N4-gp56 family major capsid protein [Candidatus Saccharibacteria bacterium]